MRRLAWTFAARIGYKYQIHLTRSIWYENQDEFKKNDVTILHCQVFLGRVYRKIPKNLNTQNIAVIILKFEQCGSTIE